MVQTGTSKVARVVLPLPRPMRVDLLFVVDNSPAMQPHRETLLANSRNFINTLNTIQGGLPDVHIAVTTTDVGTRGANETSSVPRGDCSTEGDAGGFQVSSSVFGSFIVDRVLADGTRGGNYLGDLDDAFAAMFDVGSSGCSVPRPLEAMRRALSNPANDGFRRVHAKLAVIFVTNHDDCSFLESAFLDGETSGCVLRDDELVPLDDYVDFLRSLALDPSDIMVASIMGPAEPFIVLDGVPRPSCTFDPQHAESSLTAPIQPAPRSAQPGVRLQAFLDRFPNRSATTTLCRHDLTGALVLFPELPTSSWPNPCLSSPLLDVDPDRPGLQPDCNAWVELQTIPITIETLPRCIHVGTDRCWFIEHNPRACPTSPFDPTIPNLAVMIRPRFSVGPVPEVAVVECAVE